MNDIGLLIFLVGFILSIFFAFTPERETLAVDTPKGKISGAAGPVIMLIGIAVYIFF